MRQRFPPPPWCGVLTRSVYSGDCGGGGSLHTSCGGERFLRCDRGMALATTQPAHNNPTQECRDHMVLAHGCVLAAFALLQHSRTRFSHTIAN